MILDIKGNIEFQIMGIDEDTQARIMKAHRRKKELGVIANIVVNINDVKINVVDIVAVGNSESTPSPAIMELITPPPLKGGKGTYYLFHYKNESYLRSYNKTTNKYSEITINPNQGGFRGKVNSKVLGVYYTNNCPPMITTYDKQWELIKTLVNANLVVIYQKHT